MKTKHIKFYFLSIAFTLCVLFASTVKASPEPIDDPLFEYNVSWKVEGGGYFNFLQIDNVMIVSSPSAFGYGSYLFPSLPTIWIYYIAIPVGKIIDYEDIDFNHASNSIHFQTYLIEATL